MKPGDSDLKAIQHVIRAQLDAFKRDDGPGALSYATPSRQRYGTGERFLEVVREGFPELFRCRKVKFGALFRSHQHWAQEVEVTGHNDAARVVVYMMERQADGSWRIDGCRYLGPAKKSARTSFAN